MKDIVNGFKEFILRGNVLDLAIAVVIGAAFTALVNSLVADIITPIIGAFGGQPDFSGLTFTINGSVFRYGLFINAVISFLIIAAVLYFLIVRPMNALMARVVPKAAEPEPTLCPDCLSPVPAGARRCPACTSWLTGDDAPAS
ncbi:MAG: large conductance mechanosensitive channel protein MscL [Thermomicrobiales bacterium]|nr:large conductance mechanosensitive channel protein MscL [Thermomicrobiales bacterium]